MSNEETPDEPSLDQLSQAFAEAMGRSGKSAPREDQTVDLEAETESTDAVVDADDDDDLDGACPISPKSIFESLLFVGHPENEPIAAAAVAKLIRGVEDDEIDGLAAELNAEYDAGEMPFQVSCEDSGYRLELREAFDDVREKFYGRIREARLSQLAVDVLAVVAYHQPISRAGVDELLDNGLNTSRVINQLVRRGLLSRHSDDADGRQSRGEFVTTDRFLELFQLDDVSDLPRSEEPQ